MGCSRKQLPTIGGVLLLVSNSQYEVVGNNLALVAGCTSLAKLHPCETAAAVSSKGPLERICSRIGKAEPYAFACKL